MASMYMVYQRPTVWAKGVTSLSTQVYPPPSPTPQSQEMHAPRAPSYSRQEPSLLGLLLQSWSPWPEIQVSQPSGTTITWTV